MITGNYNAAVPSAFHTSIISYQVITGNYNNFSSGETGVIIISYQVITGNYNFNVKIFR